MRESVLTSSVLIAVIVLLRYAFRGKIAPRLQYALWLLAAARLLIPGTFFTVPVSVMGAADELSAVFEKSLPESARGSPDELTVTPALSAAGTVSGAGPAGTEPAALPESESRRPAVNWLDLIWKTGICATGGAMALSNLIFYFQLRGKRRRLTLPPGSETGNLPVYLVEDLPSPCLFGLFCPSIYLNLQALDPAHLPYVLSHERTHFRHGDHLWSVLRGVCLAVCWYNPLVWLAASLSRQDCELACDDSVIWMLGERQRLDYGSALVRMITPSRPSLLRASTSMTAGKRNMKERILLITRRPRMLKLTTALVALVMCGAVAVTFGASAAASAGGLTPADQDALLPQAPRPITRLDSASYTHFSGLFSLRVPEDWVSGLLYEENEDGVYFYDAASYREAPDESCLLAVYPQASAWAAAYNQGMLSLDEFDGSGSPYVYLLDCNRTDNERVQALCDAAARSFHLHAGADAFSRLVHGLYETNMPVAVAYLPYLSWESYRSLYGEKETLSLLTDLTAFVQSGEADWNQYHDIMSNYMGGGAGADAYQDLIWSLYQQNPSQFASVLESEFLTSGERDHMLSWFRSALAVKQDWPEALELSDAALCQLLGISEWKSVG